MLVGEVRIATTGRWILLEIVRRQPLGFRRDEAVEEPPVQQGISHGGAAEVAGQPPDSPQRRRAQRVRDGRRDRPQQEKREHGDRQRPEPRGVRSPERQQRATSDQDAPAHRGGRPHRPPHLPGRAGRLPFGGRRGLPLQQVAAGHEESPERAHDRVDRDVRLVRQHGDRQHQLLRAGDRIPADGGVVGPPRLVERRPQRRQQQGDQPGRRDRAESQERPPDRRAGENGPAGDQEQRAGRSRACCAGDCRGSSSARAARAGWARDRQARAPAWSAREAAASRPGSSGACAGHK